MSLLGLDIGLFLAEISKHSVLWNHSSEDKNNRLMKNKIWTKIAGIFVEDFDQLGNSDKLEIVRKIQLKWRNLRDTYVRGHRSNATKRGYIYRKYMTFLDPIYNFDQSVQEDEDQPSEESSTISKRAKVEVYSENEDDNDMYFDSQPPKMRKPQRVKPKTSNIEFVTAQPSSSDVRMRADADDDVSFFESLLPAVKQFDMDQKLVLRTEILNLITRIRTHESFNPFKQNDSCYSDNE